MPRAAAPPLDPTARRLAELVDHTEARVEAIIGRLQECAEVSRLNRLAAGIDALAERVGRRP